jgi:hypothetical protein
MFRKSDQEAISLVIGNGKNGYAKGVFAMEFDANHNTDSKVFNNFRGVSQSNDVASFGILSPTQIFPSRIAKNVGGKVILLPMKQAYGADNNVAFKDGIAGQTIIPDRGKIIEGLVYTNSGDNTTRVYVANDASQEEIVVTTAHEIGGHVFLSNFGRSIPNGMHAPLDPNFDKQVQEIER